MYGALFGGGVRGERWEGVGRGGWRCRGGWGYSSTLLVGTERCYGGWVWTVGPWGNPSIWEKRSKSAEGEILQGNGRVQKME